MSQTDDLQEFTTDEEFDASSVPSLDDFLRELEEREKSLSINAASEIEVEDIYGFREDTPAQRPQAPVVPKHELEKLQSQIKTLQKEREDMASTMRRRQADFDSFRGRTERERNETFQTVLINLANRLLPVVDNLNRALDLASRSEEQSPSFEQFLQGIVLVNQQIHDVLGEMGIVPIQAIGKDFDPHFHEAVAAEKNNELPPNTIIEELLRGYRLGPKVIRPAMVKVAS